MGKNSQKTPSDEVADEVQAWRRRHGWSYRQLAEATGISEDVLVNILTRRTRSKGGQSIPPRAITIEELVAFAKAFDTSLIHFLPRSAAPEVYSFELRFDGPEAFAYFSQRYEDLVKDMERESNQPGRQS